MLADERGRRFACCERGMPQGRREKRLIRRHAEGGGLFEAMDQPAPRLIASRAMADQLRDHRVIERRNFKTGLQRMLDADFVWHLPQRHFSGLRHEIVGRILRA